MKTVTTGQTTEQQITALLQQWTEAVRHNDKASIWRNHDPQARIFDALPPIQYPDLQAYQDNWDSWQPPFAEPPRFEFTGLQICAGTQVAFAHGLLRCTGRLKDGTELDDQVRATFGFVRRDGRWLFTHQHISMPLPGGGDGKH